MSRWPGAPSRRVRGCSRSAGRQGDDGRGWTAMDSSGRRASGSSRWILAPRLPDQTGSARLASPAPEYLPTHYSSLPPSLYVSASGRSRQLFSTQ